MADLLRINYTQYQNTRGETLLLILGQVNFFAEFAICFFRSELAFEIRPRA